MTKYSDDEYFHLDVKKLIALIVVPIDEVITAFDLIANQFGNDTDDLLNYVEKTGSSERKRRSIFLFFSNSRISLTF